MKLTPKTALSGKENSSTPKKAATPKSTPKSAKKEERKSMTPTTVAVAAKTTPATKESAVKRTATPIKVKHHATCQTNM